MSEILLLNQLEEVLSSITSLNNTPANSKTKFDATLDDKNITLVNDFLLTVIYNSLELECLSYVGFFDDNKKLLIDFLAEMQSLVSNKLLEPKNKLYFRLNDNMNIFVTTRDMALEFKEIYYDLIPNINQELNLESSELKKLVAFSKIDLEDSKYSEDYTIDQLLQLAKTGGNALFFGKNIRSSTISEKRLSLLSNHSSNGFSEARRKRMPIFLNKRDMMIFEDLLEIEKLNDALFWSLRQILSEKIEEFNGKYNSKNIVFKQLFAVIKDEYLKLDRGFEDLTLLLKGLEQKVTVYRWSYLIDKLFADCLYYIENGIFDAVKENASVLKEGVELIQKHILLFQTLINASWDDFLYQKLSKFKDSLIVVWKETKIKLNIVDEIPSIEPKDKTADKRGKDDLVKRNSLRKSILGNEKRISLSQSEKRQSVGASIFQKLNLRASLVSSAHTSPTKLQYDSFEFDSSTSPLASTNTDVFLKINQPLYLDSIHSEELLTNNIEDDVNGWKKFQDSNDELHSFEKTFTAQNVDSPPSSQTLDTHTEEQSTVCNYVATSSSRKLKISKATLLKYAKIKTKIPQSNYLSEFLLVDSGSSSLSSLKNLLLLENKNVELVMDTNRAHSVYDIVTEFSAETSNLSEMFKKMSIKEPTFIDALKPLNSIQGF